MALHESESGSKWKADDGLNEKPKIVWAFGPEVGDDGMQEPKV